MNFILWDIYKKIRKTIGNNSLVINFENFAAAQNNPKF